MGGLDPAKILFILVLALVVLGPERLPKAARQIGALWHDFQQWRQRFEEEVRSAVPDLDLPPLPPLSRGGITSYLAGMMTEAERSRAGATVTEADAGPSAQTTDGESSSSWRAARANGDARSVQPTADTLAVPNGVPASWGASTAELPGHANGSLLSPMPSAAPEATLEARVRLDLDDPSWN
jgi:hypothetical protein